MWIYLSHYPSYLKPVQYFFFFVKCCYEQHFPQSVHRVLSAFRLLCHREGHWDTRQPKTHIFIFFKVTECSFSLFWFSKSSFIDRSKMTQSLKYNLKMEYEKDNWHFQWRLDSDHTWSKWAWTLPTIICWAPPTCHALLCTGGPWILESHIFGNNNKIFLLTTIKIPPYDRKILPDTWLHFSRPISTGQHEAWSIP